MNQNQTTKATPSDVVHLETALEILKDFPRILHNVKDFWYDAELLCAYLTRLLQDTRDGNRVGFPSGVASFLFLLYNNRISECNEIKPKDDHPFIFATIKHDRIKK